MSVSTGTGTRCGRRRMYDERWGREVVITRDVSLNERSEETTLGKENEVSKEGAWCHTHGKSYWFGRD